MNKLTRMYRRFRLGRKYKHQYRCHPSFGLIRDETGIKVTWKRKTVARLATLGELKNKFSGSCFTIATGPSLKEIDLRRAENYASISLNCAIKKFSEHQLKPTHCIIIDHRIFEKNWECVKDSILSGAYCFFSDVGLSRICEREPDLLKNKNIYLVEGIGRQFGITRESAQVFHERYDHDAEIFMDADFPDDRGTIGFSSNPEKGFFTGKTVATWAVQLAYYLGYQNNFIAGMDLGGTGRAYFYGKGDSRPPVFLRVYEPAIRVCFEQTRRAAEKLGFSVYNLSEQSILPDEIIPKISYDEALSLAAIVNEEEYE